ncbi:MAG: adenylate/guanylate cyclase domain-containing protein [Pseudomonadota bacterium]
MADKDARADRDPVERRVRGAFARAEWQGLTTALWARLATLIAIQIWLLIAVPKTYTIFYHAWILLFLLLGAAQLYLMQRRIGERWLAYAFAILDGVLLGVALLVPNPLFAEPYPPEMILRYANIIFVFLLLAGAALSYNPGLVLCAGFSAMIVWRIGVSILASLPGAITSKDEVWLEAEGVGETLRLFLDPEFVHLNMQNKKVFVVVLVTILLAAVVSRARRLVLTQVSIERARTNLARYFSPNLVDELAGQDQPLGAVRRQSVAVLFADIQGFTSLSEAMPPEEVVDLLRSFHERMETAVFAHDGTLDKYMGDGLMATFGTPNPGDHDATNALLAARRMLTELGELNDARQAAAEHPINLSIGIHYGPVVQGDIGGGRRLEFTVLGDTVNVASRLEAMTRELDTSLVISSDMVDQLKKETADPDLSGLVEGSPTEVRGRTSRLGIWTMGGAATSLT